MPKTLRDYLSAGEDLRGHYFVSLRYSSEKLLAIYQVCNGKFLAKHFPSFDDRHYMQVDFIGFMTGGSPVLHHLNDLEATPEQIAEVRRKTNPLEESADVDSL